MQLNYHRQGEGFPVLLIHGLFGSLENLGTLSRHLQTSFDVISVDLINHGRSPHVASTSYPEMAADILDTMSALNIEHAHFIGHSMGGKVAMELAMLAPEKINRLVVADIAPVEYPNHHTQVFSALAELSKQLPVESRHQADTILALYLNEPGVRQFLLRNLERKSDGFHWRFNYAGILESYAQIRAATTDTPPFNKPTLFIKGGYSDYITDQYKGEIMRRFPQASLKIIQDAGHWLHAEKPTIFNRLVDNFLTAEED
jgi:esterase